METIDVVAYALAFVICACIVLLGALYAAPLLHGYLLTEVEDEDTSTSANTGKAKDVDEADADRIMQTLNKLQTHIKNLETTANQHASQHSTGWRYPPNDIPTGPGVHFPDLLNFGKFLPSIKGTVTFSGSSTPTSASPASPGSSPYKSGTQITGPTMGGRNINERFCSSEHPRISGAPSRALRRGERALEHAASTLPTLDI